MLENTRPGGAVDGTDRIYETHGTGYSALETKEGVFGSAGVSPASDSDGVRMQAGRLRYPDRMLAGRLRYPDRMLAGRLRYPDRMQAGRLRYPDRMQAGHLRYRDRTPLVVWLLGGSVACRETSALARRGLA